MSEEYDPSTESDLRRRAAWLLGMLVVVAALVVTIMVTVLGGSGGGSNGDTVADPATPGTSSSPQPTSSAALSTPRSASASSPATSPGTSTSASTSPSRSASRRTSCPDAKPCILDGDVGGAVKAINDYRAQHGQKAVPGKVGKLAQQCALNNGGGCSGGWAETQVAKPDGPAAVQKILQFGKLLDPTVKSIQVGWAYDPGAKQYYFALIREG